MDFSSIRYVNFWMDLHIFLCRRSCPAHDEVFGLQNLQIFFSYIQNKVTAVGPIQKNPMHKTRDL